MPTELIINYDDPREKQNFRRLVDTLTGRKKVTIANFQRRRSNQANAYLWGVVYPAFVEFRQEQGEEFTADMAHEFFKLKFLRQPVVNVDTGEVLGQTVRSTAKLPKDEFGVYIEKVVAWLAHYGIEVPPPSTYCEPEQRKSA